MDQRNNNSTAITRREQTAVAYPAQQGGFGELMEMAQVFAESGFFSDSRDAAKAVVKIMAGKELGLPPIVSMTGINLIKNKITISANTMAGIIK